MQSRTPRTELDFRSSAALLEGTEGVTTLHIPCGQTLYYAGQVAPGLYVLLSGTVRLSRGAAADALGPLRDASAAPFILPRLDAIDTPSNETVATVSDVRALFVPRTLVFFDHAVWELLGGMDTSIRAVPVGKGMERV